MTCPHCRTDVPQAPYCVRCGEPLESRDSPYPHETRGFAAAPHQRVNSPRIVSTLFPHLPRAEMIAFESTLLGGAAAIVVLSVLRLFPLALIAAAALVPFLVVLYLWSVKLYEDEPLPMLLFTIVWGAVAGVGLGLAARHVNTTLDLLTERTGGHTVLWIGVLLPLLTVAVTVAGPLALIGYRRFDGVLDGATFGSACAVSCLSAEAITNSAGFLGGGLRAAGTTSLWVARLLTLGVAVPVVGAGAVGAACAAFWLRYRAPLRDRGALGVLGSPAVAVAAAAAASSELTSPRSTSGNGRRSRSRPRSPRRRSSRCGGPSTSACARRRSTPRSDRRCAARTATARPRSTTSAPAAASRSARSRSPAPPAPFPARRHRGSIATSSRSCSARC